MSTGITCTALPNVTNGTIDYSSGTTALYDYETTATYRCNLGHVLTSGDSVGTCTGDGSTSSGQWHVTAPQCPRMFYVCSVVSHDNVHTAVDCSTPLPITNGSPGIPTTTTYQGTAIYNCDTGYWITRGLTTANATCMADKRWGPLPTCQRT